MGSTMKKVLCVIMCLILLCTLASCKTEMDSINEQIEDVNKNMESYRENPLASIGEFSYTDSMAKMLENPPDPALIFNEDGTVIIYDNDEEQHGTYVYENDKVTISGGEDVGTIVFDCVIDSDLKYYLELDGARMYVEKD